MSYVTRSGAEFRYQGKRFKFIGFNYYPAIVSSVSQASLQNLFSALSAKIETPIVRTWCFDVGNPPSDSGGNFRFLDYPLGTNLITNPSLETDLSGWEINANEAYPDDTTRSNSHAHAGSYSIKQESAYNTYQSFYYLATVEANTDYVWTFWYKVQALSGDGSHFPPSVRVKEGVSGDEILDNGILGAANVWTRRQVFFNSGSNTSVRLYIVNFGGQNISYFDDMNLCVQGTPSLATRESTFVQLDRVMDEARKVGAKMILSLADNPTYLTKKTYCTWANAINGAGLSTSTPYIGFFTSEYCKDMFKAFIDLLAERVNTINGRLYSEDDSIFSIELGNELRLDRDDPSGVNDLSSANLALMSKPDGWIDEMSTYAKTKFPNHLVSFSSCSHTWQWTNGDTVSNGTYYGVDYDFISDLPNIDYLDFHCYPNQSDNVNLLKYGQRLGFPNSVSGAGFRAQLRDYIAVGHGNGKPVICGETGIVQEVIGSRTHYPLWPRHDYLKEFCKDFLDLGGDGVLLWHATAGATSSSYDIALSATGGEAIEDSTNDTKLVSYIAQKNYQIKGQRIPVNAQRGIVL